MNWSRLYRLAYLLLLIAGPLFALCYFMIAMNGLPQRWFGVNVMAVADQVLGAWGIFPPFLSWTIMGSIIVFIIYFAVWEGHRIDIPKTRWLLLCLPWLLLAIGPLVWPMFEVHVTRSLMLPGAANDPRPGEISVVQGIELVWIPPGRFRMGSPTTEPGHEDDEALHVVTLQYGFWMGRYEVTRAQWNAVMQIDATTPELDAQEPITGVTYQDCRGFMGKLNAARPGGFRLPTEAEWEYACRAMTETPYAFGEDASRLAEFAWYADNSEKKPHRVGMKAPNAFGVYDMCGNVWEWCGDWYGAYPQRHAIDPTGVDRGSYHVIRGGAFDSPPQDCRSAARNFFMEGYFSDQSTLGFRVVRGPTLGAPYVPPPATNAGTAQEAPASTK